MKKLPQLLRLIHIQWIIARYRLDKLVVSIPLFASFRFLTWFNPWNWRPVAMPRGVRLRLALEELGPIFVKFGQMLSTRRDMLPDDIADELAMLQDRVPAFPGTQAQALLEELYGQPLTELFQEFDILPLASASIAQVHAARLLDGREVVIKVLRPGIQQLVRRDIELLYTIAGLAERFWKESRRLHPSAIVAEFQQNLFDELDLLHEAGNASQLRRNFKDGQLLYVPEIYWPYARSTAIVMERIHGIPISHVAELKRQQINLAKLAERGVEIFFTQVFRDSFFHADMHPGNIFVDPSCKEYPRYIGVDFGIMGTLNSQDQRYLAENLLAFFKRDYRRVAELHVECGWVPKNTRVDQFEGAIRAVCEPIFERPLKDISFGQMLLKFFQTARRFNMEVQPQLVLLQKTLINIEGLGKQLYPELDLWRTAKPFLEHWMRQQMGPKALWRKIRDKAPYWAERFPEMPDLFYGWLQQSQHSQSSRLVIVDQTLHRAKRQAYRKGLLTAGIGFVTLLVLIDLGYHYYFLG